MNKVLVIGDIITDKYIYGTSERLSPEAPVPIVKYTHEKETLGGAGLVYNNLKSLGVDVELIDYFDKTSVKTRVICDGHYVTRIDDDYFVDGTHFYNHILRQDFSKYDYVILSDYNKGTLDRAIEIIAHISKYNCRIIVDPKRHASYYKGAWLVKPNAKEFSELGFDNWLGNIITTYAGGDIDATIDHKRYTVSPEPVEVSDVTGAGDCFLAAFVYALTKGYNYQRSLNLAAEAATKTVKQVGTVVLLPSDLHTTTVFTNGVFDILHKGHLELLKQARSKGDKLVVGINSDASVKRLKGESRPINNQQERKEQLKLLPWVDAVVIFEEDTPYELIKTIQPNLIVKGGDYTVEQVVGCDLADVHIVPTVEGYSTTKIIEASK